MRIERRWFVRIPLLLLALVVVGVEARADDKMIRWDIVSLQPPNAMAGGIASARANDGSKITLTGSGTFAESDGDDDDVTGGGTWMTFDSVGRVTGNGKYKVTGLVRFEVAPGVAPPGLIDHIGRAADAHAGLAILRIRYSDGSRGILVVSCHLLGTPDSVFEGVTASKGFVYFWEREAPSDVPFRDANRTVFHIVRDDD